MKQQVDASSSAVPPSEGKRLTLLYVLALSTVAALSVGAQWLIQRQLDRGERDSHVINVAGRQRMLSQQLTKSSLQLARAEEVDKLTLRKAIGQALEEWQANHAALREGTSTAASSGRNSPAVDRLFVKLEPEYQAMLHAGFALQDTDADMNLHLATMEDHEGAFLEGMDRIVSQYVFEAEAKVRWLRRLEIILLGLTLAVLATEGLIVFRPAVRRIEQTVARLGRTNERLMQARDDAEHANAAKSRFLASISHELRTPMTAVLGMAELARVTSESDKREEYLAIILEAGHSLLALLNDLIDLAAIDANEVRLDEKAFAPKEVGARVAKLLRPLAQAKGLEITYQTESAQPDLVLGDEQRVQQVLVNLVGNAIKYTTKGRVLIVYRSFGSESDTSELQWTVHDTGRGIAPHDLKRVFEPFTQVTDASNTSSEGIGLGLSVCKRIAETMGGEVQLESQLGVGTFVRFSAPFQRVAYQKDLERVNTAPPVRSLRILVVEDSEVNQLLLRELLPQHGHRASIAGSGEEAIESYRREAFDCVLIDMQLPGINGLETRRILEEFDDGQPRRVPKLCITAHVSGEDYCDFDAVIIKPFTSRGLLATLAAVTSHTDTANARSHESLGRSLERELAETYLSVATSEAERLCLALTEQRWHDARVLVHRLRGQVGYFDAGSLGEDLRRLELACEAGDAAEATVIAKQVQPQLTELATRLEHQYATIDK